MQNSLNYKKKTKMKNLYKFAFLILILWVKSVFSESTNCMVLSSVNSFGRIGNGSYFTQSIELVEKIIVNYTNDSIYGIKFELINGQNMILMENSSNLVKTEIIDLKISYLSGVDIWIDLLGIIGFQFQVYDNFLNKNNFTSKFGSTRGCHFYLNSTFMRSKYFKINSISGFVDISAKVHTFIFEYSFSQCPFYNLTFSSTSTSLSTLTASEQETVKNTPISFTTEIPSSISLSSTIRTTTLTKTTCSRIEGNNLRFLLRNIYLLDFNFRINFVNRTFLFS